MRAGNSLLLKLFILILFGFPIHLTAAESVLYQLTIDSTDFARIHVAVTIPATADSEIIAGMPRWMPGAYVVADYGQYVKNITAHTRSRKKLAPMPLSGNRWCISRPIGQELYLHYDLESSSHIFLGPALDSTQSLLHGAATWIYIKGMEKRGATVKLVIPKRWQIATPLRPTQNSHEFFALSYDELVDAPILCSQLTQSAFKLKSTVPIKLYFSGPVEFDLIKFTAMTQKIVEYQVDLFGDIPFEDYTFLFRIFPGRFGGGGLEHGNSTIIGLAGTLMHLDYKNAANIIAHEFFHLWNVKRIAPTVLMPIRYDQEARTTCLWFLEGLTSYYADLTLLRTGIWSPDEFFRNQELQIVELQQNPDRLRTTVADASWKSWENGYFYSGISYYTKGQLLAWLLDLEMRTRTDNRCSLDDCLRFMNYWYAKNGRGFEEGDLLRVMSSLSQSDFSSFFEKYIYGTLELPYREILRTIGLDIEIHTKSHATLGRLRMMGEQNRLQSLEVGGPLDLAGIRRGDLIIALDHIPVSDWESINNLITKKVPGDTIQVQVRRDGVKMTFIATLGESERVECHIQPAPMHTPRQVQLYQNWLTAEPLALPNH